MKKTTRTLMLAVAATVISGSAFAQVDTTTKDTSSTSVPQTDTTTSTHPKKDKKKDKKAPPQAFVSPVIKSNTYTLVATNKEMLDNKITELEEETTEA